MSEDKYDYKEVCLDIAARKKMEDAAPDLYEALVELLSYLDGCGMESFRGDKARAAIAKATP